MSETPAPFLTAKLVITEKQFQDILFAATLSGIVAGELMNREVNAAFLNRAILMCPTSGPVDAPYVLELLNRLKAMQGEEDIPALLQTFTVHQDENPVFSPEYRAMSKEIVPGFFELNADIDFMAIWTQKMLDQFKGGPRG